MPAVSERTSFDEKVVKNVIKMVGGQVCLIFEGHVEGTKITGW